MHREKQYFKPKGMSPCYMKHLIIAGLFYNVTFVMMKGPNKSILKLKKICFSKSTTKGSVLQDVHGFSFGPNKKSTDQWRLFPFDSHSF